MKLPQIIFSICIILSLVSCLNGASDKINPSQKNKPVPSTKYQKPVKSHPKSDRKESIEKPIDKELQQKKLKGIDTLKPVVAIP